MPTHPSSPARPRALPLAAPRAATLDAVGTAVSCACAVHCLVLPAVVALLPALGLGRLLGARVEWAFLATTVLVGVWSLGPAAWRERRAWRGARPLLLFLAGAAALAGARLGALGGAAEGGGRERLLVTAGAALVVAAHVANWRRGRRCEVHAVPNT